MLARRSCLSVPGSSQRMLENAGVVPADELVLDLEDAVAAAAKDEARAAVAAILRDRALPGRLVAVRVNGLDTPWCQRDVLELAALGDRAPATIVVPKVERAADIETIVGLLDSADGGAARIGLQALIETAAGLQHAGEIAAASPRIQALILGYVDLRASLGRPADPAEPPERWWFAQETVLVAARAAAVQAIDGPFLGVRDTEGLRAWASHTRALGFDGKWAIHPAQVVALNAVFSPTEQEFERASAVIAALDAAAADGARGAVAVDGEMVDEASRKLAVQVVARGAAAGLGA